MKTLPVIIALLLSFNSFASEGWTTDFEKASEKASKTNKYMLLDFSGSDWCGWCIKLDEEVFSTPEFKAWASENLITVLLDFPKTKEIAPELKEQNKNLAQKYGVRGFPTVLILTPEGELAGKTGYQAGGPEKYIENIKGIISSYSERKNAIASGATEMTIDDPAYTLTYPISWEAQKNPGGNTAVILFSPAAEGTSFRNNLNLMISPIEEGVTTIDEFHSTSFEQLKGFMPDVKEVSSKLNKNNSSDVFQRSIFAGSARNQKIKFIQDVRLEGEKFFIMLFSSRDEEYETLKDDALKIMDSFVLKSRIKDGE